MNRLNPTLIYALLILALPWSGCKTNVSPRSLTGEETTKESLDDFVFNVQHAYSIPGLAIGIVKDGATYYKTAGESQLPQRHSFTDSTIFFTGNLSELIVSTATMKLVESGKIQLDDPVVKHLSYFKTGGDRYHTITIRHLLTHTSGIAHHAATWDLPNEDENALELTTRSVASQEPEFKIPGSQVKRSPYNYDILADLISKVSGQSFEEYVKQAVFIPLGMDHSTFYLKDVPATRLALPHKIINWLTYAVAKEETYPYNREHAGSAGFHTSIKDITAWMSMVLQEGKIADKSFLRNDLYHELINVNYKTGDHYFVGLGWEIEKANDHFIFRKGHRMAGFSADIVLIPTQHTGVITVSNISADFNPDFINDQIVHYLQGEELNRPKIPIGIVMGRRFNATESLDSAFHLYKLLKQNQQLYNCSLEALSQVGVNFLYRLNNPAKAKEVFSFCIQEFPSSASAYLNLAEAELLTGDLKHATESLLKAKHLTADTPDVAARMSYLEEKLTAQTENILLTKSNQNQP